MKVNYVNLTLLPASYLLPGTEQRTPIDLMKWRLLRTIPSIYGSHDRDSNMQILKKNFGCQMNPHSKSVLQSPKEILIS
jgi:hypothetical protein